MEFLRRFSFNAQSVLLLLFFSAGQSYAMLSLSEKQVACSRNRNKNYSPDIQINMIRNREDRLFIKDFPNMTLEQAGERFGNYSPVVQKNIIHMVAKKDSDNDSKLFLAAFFMATTLPQEVQKLILTDEMFAGNGMATEKFLEMPIGRALEWYALCQEASRSKLIYLPIFEKKLKGRGLVDIQRPSITHLVDLKERGFEVIFGDDLVIATLDTDKHLNGLYNGCCGDALNKFLDDAAGLFFQLSKQDIILLMDYDDNVYYRDKPATLNDVNQLVAIDKIAPFLKDRPRIIRYVKEYSRADVIDFIEIGAKNGLMYVFPVLTAPLCLAGLSKFIEAKFCKKILDEGIARRNAGVWKMIHDEDQYLNALYKRGLQYDGMNWYRGYLIKMLRDPMRYSVVDCVKKGLPLLVPVPVLSGVNFIYGSPRQDTVEKVLMGGLCGYLMTIGLANLANSPLMQDGKSFAMLIGAAGALSVFAGILWNIGREYFSGDGMVNSDAIEALLESIDTKIANQKMIKK